MIAQLSLQGDLSSSNAITLPCYDDIGSLIIVQILAQIEYTHQQATKIVSLDTAYLFDNDMNTVIDNCSQQIIELIT